MAAPTIAAVGPRTSQRTTGALSIDVTTDAATLTGDVLVAVIAGRYRSSLSGAIDAPVGWTRLTPQQRPPALPGVTTRFAADAFMRTATADGAQTFTFTLGAGFLVSGLILKEVNGAILNIRGIQSSSPFSAPVATYGTNAAASPYVPAGMAVSRDDSLAIVLWAKTSYSTSPFDPDPRGWYSPPAAWQRALDPSQEVRYATIETDATVALPMPDLASGATRLISWTFAVHGFPDFFAYGVQTGTPTGPSAAYGVY